MLKLFKDELEEAVENGWPMKLIKPSGAFLVPGGIDSSAGLIKCVEDDLNNAGDASAVAVMGNMLPEFICIDIDTKDKQAKKDIFTVLAKNFGERNDFFFRVGHPDKGGQFWFRCIDNLHSYEEQSVEGVVDIIFKSKRCDALGSYKGTDRVYEWPSLKFWELTPEDMPIISISVIDQIIDAARPYGKHVESTGLKSRHDSKIKKMATLPGLGNIVEQIWKMDEFQSHVQSNYLGDDKWKDNRVIPREDARSLLYVIEKRLSELTRVGGTITFADDDEFVFDDIVYQKVERNSLLDIIYGAIKKNMAVENREVCFLVALSICSYIVSHLYSFKGLNLNLMLLYVGTTGCGKSTALQAFHEVGSLFPKIFNGIRGEESSSMQGMVSGIAEDPISIIVFDEISTLFRSIGNSKSTFSDSAELLTKLYSNPYKITPFFRRLANTVKDPVGNIRLSMIGMTNKNVFKYLTSDLYEQGLMRRFLPMVDLSMKDRKTGWSKPKSFFTEVEKEKIQSILRGMLGTGLLKTKMNIGSLELPKGLDKKGETVFWQECWKGCETVNLNSSIEVDGFLENDLPTESNRIMRILSGDTDVLRLSLMSSYAENIIKLSAIHSLCGKNCLSQTYKGNKNSYTFSPNTKVDMDSINWAKSNLVYWFLGDGMDKINSNLSKDSDIEDHKTTQHAFLTFLQTKELREFKMGHRDLREYFSTRELRKAKVSVIQSLIDNGKLVTDEKSNALRRGCTIRVVDT